MYIILDFLATTLLPHKDQHESTGASHSKAHSRNYFPPGFGDDEIGGDISCNLGQSDGESIDEEVELELIEHEAGRIEAEADDAEEENE